MELAQDISDVVFDGLFGDAHFLPNGQLQPRYVVFKVVDGKTAKFEALQ